MPVPRKRKRPLLTRAALWSLPVLAVLFIAGFIAVRLWFYAYLRSDAFRHLIGGLTSNQIKAQGEYLPFSFSDSAIYSDGYKARGGAKAPFSDLRAEQIRANINLGGLWHHAWEIDDINIQRLLLSLGHTGGAEPVPQPGLAPQESTAPPSMPRFKWLPDHVDLRKVVIQDTTLRWGEATERPGAINGAQLTITPDGDAWNILCESGTISQLGGPDLGIEQATLRYQRPTLFITDAALRYNSDSTIDLSGEVDFGKEFNVLAKLNGISIIPLLRPDWRAKLKGDLSGSVKISSPIPLAAGPRVEGSLSLAQGELEALPVLDEIATFTSTERFRRISLTRVTADFTRTDSMIHVTNLIAESEGLIRMEGSFTVQNGIIDGTFQVGITPSSMQWIPAALQNKIFIVSHDGYMWTTMRITGPVEHPGEDLSRRLAAALIDAGLDTAKGILNEIPGADTIQGAPKKLIDDFLTPLIGK